MVKKEVTKVTFFDHPLCSDLVKKRLIFIFVTFVLPDSHTDKQEISLFVKTIVKMKKKRPQYIETNVTNCNNRCHNR